VRVDPTRHTLLHERRRVGRRAAAIASTGFASTLLLQERLIALTGEESGVGLHANGMKAMQAVGATLAGLLAQYLPVGTAMVTLAVASIAVTVALSPGLRLSNPSSRLRVRGVFAVHQEKSIWDVENPRAASSLE
jgi:hypothetical protein